jgi:uncharacterized protein
MKLEWDATKDAANRAKHGVSLADAARLDWASGELEVDDRDYGEMRLIYYGPIDGRMMVCVHVLRGGVRRIISLRKANKRERLAHGQT